MNNQTTPVKEEEIEKWFLNHCDGYTDIHFNYIDTLHLLKKFAGYAASTPSEQGSDGWIDSEKQKPPYNKAVMVFIPEEDYHQTSGMWDIDNKWVLLDEYRVPENPVTHWRELYDIPEPYKTERQELYKVVQFPTPPQSKPVNT